MVSLRDVALTSFLDLIARDRADDLLGDLSALKMSRVGSRDVELAGGVGIFSSTFQFHDFNLSA